jgi:hypothetical protein
MAGKTRQLILSEEPINRMQWKRPIPSAGIALVGKTPDGTYEIINQLGLITKYRLRFEVDIADHHDVVKCSLPSRGDAFSFDGTLVLDWRVSDPIMIVKRQIRDGLALCYARLLEELRQISRSFEIEACAQAEAEINRVLIGALPITLPEGITVHRFSAQLKMDDGSLKAIQQLRAAQHENSIATVKSGGAQEVQDIEQDGSLRRQRERMEAIQAAVRGNYDLVAIHLSQHPDDTGSLINMIRSDYQTGEERRDRMILELLKRGLIQDIDVGDMNSALLSAAADSYRSGPPRTIGLPPATPLPIASISSTGTAPQPVAASATAPTTPGSSAVPTGTSPGKDQQLSGSGVVGWRQLPPRPGVDEHDRD